MPQEHLNWMQSYIEKLCETPILENFLGLQFVRLEEGRVTLTALIEQKHCNLYGFVHGGTLSSISDIAMGVACMSQGKRVVTIDMSVSYIKNAPSGSELTAIGTVISSGRTIMRAVGEIYCGEQLLVRSQASYYVTGDFSENDCAPA